MIEKRVLLLSHSAEPFVTARVAEELRLRGASPFRLNTDRLFDEGPFGISLSPQDPGTVWFQEKPLHADKVWCWRLWPRIEAKGLRDEHRAVVEREASALVMGALSLLDADWVDPIDRIRTAENKMLQLKLARRAGLRVPETRYTSDPSVVRDLYEAQRGRLICKLHSPAAYGMSAKGAFPTRRLRAADLDRIESLRYGPMIFQEEIEKALELRVAWAGGAALTGAIEGNRAEVDWRFSQSGSFLRHPLDEDTKKKISIVMKQLGLRQACLDLIVTPEGETVFLEINPTGEWGMLEAELGLPIAASIAETLLREEEP